MDLLILGGTGWLGREIARQAVARGDAVSCLARGAGGPVADGATLIARRPAATRARTTRSATASGTPSSRCPGSRTWCVARCRRWASGRGTGPTSRRSACTTRTPRRGVRHDENAAVVAPTDRDDTGRPRAVRRGEGGLRAGVDAVRRRSVAHRPGGADRRTGRSHREVRLLGGPRRPGPGRPAAGARLPGPAHPGHRCARPRVAGCSTRAAAGTTGVFDAVGPIVPFGSWIELSRRRRATRAGAAGRPGLAARTTASRRGWVRTRCRCGWWMRVPRLAERSGAAALAAGLTQRSRTDLLADLLRWEREQGLDRDASRGAEPGQGTGTDRRSDRHGSLTAPDHGASAAATPPRNGRSSDSSTHRAKSQCRNRFASRSSSPAIRSANPAGSATSRSGQFSMCCNGS